MPRSLCEGCTDAPRFWSEKTRAVKNSCLGFRLCGARTRRRGAHRCSMDNPARASRRGDHSQRLALRVLFALRVDPADRVVGRLATVGAGELGDIGRAGVAAQEAEVGVRIGGGSASRAVMPKGRFRGIRPVSQPRLSGCFGQGSRQRKVVAQSFAPWKHRTRRNRAGLAGTRNPSTDKTLAVRSGSP